MIKLKDRHGSVAVTVACDGLEFCLWHPSLTACSQKRIDTCNDAGYIFIEDSSVNLRFMDGTLSGQQPAASHRHINQPSNLT